MARLRFLQKIETHTSMLEFRIGERVTFCPEQPPVTGMITRNNKKTVSIVPDAPDPRVNASTLDMDMGNVITLRPADKRSR